MTEGLDGADVTAEEALHLGVHHLRRKEGGREGGREEGVR